MSNSYTSYADKFELLLEMFPFPDREDAADPEDRKWRNSELEQATRRRLSSSYLSQFRRGKIDDPSVKKLDLIALVMGFPTELWVSEPEEWAEKLRRNPRRGLRAEDFIGPSFPKVLRRKIDDLKTGGSLRFDTSPGAPVGTTLSDIVARSRGRLSAEEVQAMLDGVLQPNLTQIFALTEVLGVSYFHEWLDPLDQVLQEEAEQRRRSDEQPDGASVQVLEQPETPANILRHLILKASENLDDDELAVAHQFMKQLVELKSRRSGSRATG